MSLVIFKLFLIEMSGAVIKMAILGVLIDVSTLC